VLNAGRVVEELRAAGSSFGTPATLSPALRWGVLLDALDGSVDPAYCIAFELIYEGYLCHYRSSRVSVLADEESAGLLAGDYFYARGLRLVAERGDVQCVDLLARLMAACAYLRSVDEPYRADDALWAYSVGGLVALLRGVPQGTVNSLFDRLEAASLTGMQPDVTTLVWEAAAELGLDEQPGFAAALAEPLHASVSVALSASD
jgi:hypothetical protein